MLNCGIRSSSPGTRARTTIALLLAVGAWLGASAAAFEARLLSAKGYVNAEGDLVRGGPILIQAGRIRAIGGDSPSDAIVDEYPDAVISPGLIDLDAQLSAAGHLAEQAQAVQPSAAAADAFDPFSRELAEALRAGVTTFVLAADDRELIGGQAALCSTWTPSGRPAVRSRGPIKLSLSPAMLREGYEPSSRSGAMSLLRSTLSRAGKKQTDGEATGFDAFARGQLPGFITTPYGADVLSAAELAREGSLKLVAFHTDEADLISQAVEPLLGIVVGPLELGSPPRAARAAAVLAAAGRKVAISGGLPYAAADSLRVGAAVAARNGLDAKLARRAITTTAAELLGVEMETGSIEVGRTADLVVFSGDPLDLRSRILAVYVGGECAYRARKDSSIAGGH